MFNISLKALGLVILMLPVLAVLGEAGASKPAAEQSASAEVVLYFQHRNVNKGDRLDVVIEVKNTGSKPLLISPAVLSQFLPHPGNGRAVVAASRSEPSGADSAQLLLQMSAPVEEGVEFSAGYAVTYLAKTRSEAAVEPGSSLLVKVKLPFGYLPGSTVQAKLMQRGVDVAKTQVIDIGK